MKLNLTCVMLIMDEITNQDIRKNSIKKLGLLVHRKNGALPTVSVNDNCDIKAQIRNELANALGTDSFHLEQVYTLGDKKYLDLSGIDIIHIGITNNSHIKQILPEYDLIDVSIKNNVITLGDKTYTYVTKEKVGFGIEYFFETDAKNIQEDKLLIELLTAWKHMRSHLDNSDILFKFLPSEFTLEDARQVYMLLSERNVDKSNFHKKITKYCTEVPGKTSGAGYRPSKQYKFNLKLGDLWQ